MYRAQILPVGRASPLQRKNELCFLKILEAYIVSIHHDSAHILSIPHAIFVRQYILSRVIIQLNLIYSYLKITHSGLIGIQFDSFS